MFRELLAQEFGRFAKLTSEQLNQLEAHYQLLSTWNRRMNLTRITELEDVVRLHYCESLFVALQLPAGPLRIVDVGSGAGFPGIPIAVLRPECLVSLVDSHQRKAVFLREGARGLPNVRVVAARAEELRTRFDWMVSRAVAPKDVFPLIARNIAVLRGERDVAALGPAWNVREVPWGKGRYLAMFHGEPST